MIGIYIGEDVQIADKTLENMYHTFSQWRSRITCIQSGFKLIKFGNSKIRQVGKQIAYEDVVANIVNILLILNIN